MNYALAVTNLKYFDYVAEYDPYILLGKSVIVPVDVIEQINLKVISYDVVIAFVEKEIFEACCAFVVQLLEGAYFADDRFNFINLLSLFLDNFYCNNFAIVPVLSLTHVCVCAGANEITEFVFLLEADDASET